MAKILFPPTRTCPECEEFGLDVTGEDVNKYECQICGSLWQRLKPINDGTGKMVNLPKKLKELIKKNKANEDKFMEKMPKIVQVKCTFCGNDMDCPESMVNSATHMCCFCGEVAEDGMSKKQIKKASEELRKADPHGHEF